MTNKIRKITRLFAIPFLLLWWLLSILCYIILLFCTLLDLNPEEFEFYIEDLFRLIKDWIKEGANSL